MNCFGDNNVKVENTIVDIESTIQFKYKVNQVVVVPNCNLPTIIKSIRYLNDYDLVEGQRTWVTRGCEYQIYYYHRDDEWWREWGWVTEAELDKVNK